MNLNKLAGMNFDEFLADPEATSVAVKRAETSSSAPSAKTATSTPAASDRTEVDAPSVSTVNVPEEAAETAPEVATHQAAPVLAAGGVAAQTEDPEAIAPEDMVAEGAIVPTVSEGYMNIPKGQAMKMNVENPDVGRAEGPAQHTMSSMTKEQFENDMLALQQGPASQVPTWIQRPDIWPAFIDFPTKRDLAAIQAAEDAGDLDDKAKADFNEHFARLSVLMQMRSEQLDQWILNENKLLDEGRIKTTTFFSSTIRRNLKSLTRERAKANQQADGGIIRPVDPFHDIKWAVAIDPYASTDDPRFAFVSRWGHSTLETFDGGTVTATDDEIYVPSGKKATSQAAQIMVQEAIERGWSYLEVNTDVAFGRELKAACQKAGLGAKISYGSLGLSLKKAEYIMPNPPKLSIARGEDGAANVAHQKLIGEDGKAPAEDIESPSGTGQGHVVQGGRDGSSGAAVTSSKSEASKGSEQLPENGGKGVSDGEVRAPFAPEKDVADSQVKQELSEPQI